MNFTKIFWFYVELTRGKITDTEQRAAVISNLRPLRLSEEKKKRKERRRYKPQLQNIIYASATQDGHQN